MAGRKQPIAVPENAMKPEPPPAPPNIRTMAMNGPQLRIWQLEAENERLRACLRNVIAASVMTSNLYGDSRPHFMAAIAKTGLKQQSEVAK